MLNHEFATWLQGYLAIRAPGTLDPKQARIILNHLNLVKAVEGSLSQGNAAIFKVVSESLRATDGCPAVLAEQVFNLLPPEQQLSGEVELAYWIQGALEIGGHTPFTLQECQIIAAKTDRMDYINEFAFYIIRQMGLIALFPQKKIIYFSEVVQRLHNMFLHDIDPTYAGDQDFFGKIHQGKIEGV